MLFYFQGREWSVGRGEAMRRTGFGWDEADRAGLGVAVAGIEDRFVLFCFGRVSCRVDVCLWSVLVVGAGSHLNRGCVVYMRIW